MLTPQREQNETAASAELPKRSASAGKSEALISVCIVNYNNRELLARCLASVFAQDTDAPIEVLIADNGSTDDSVTWMKRERPEVRLFENANIGFSRANNQLIGHASGSMILLLNNDCLLEKNTLRELLAVMQEDRHIGILGCRILTAEGILQPTYMTISPWYFLVPNPAELYWAHVLTFGEYFGQRVSVMKAYELRHGYDRFREVHYVSAVCVLIRRDVFDAIGALDETFFMYYEDADLCVRARKAGWKVCYTPTVLAYHFVRKKETKASVKLLTEARFSQYYFVKKHYGQPWAALILLRYCLQLVFLFVFGGAKSLVRRQTLLEWLMDCSWHWKALKKILSPASEN